VFLPNLASLLNLNCPVLGLLPNLCNLANLLNLDSQLFGLLKLLESSLGNRPNPNGPDSLPSPPKILGHLSEPLFLLGGLLFGLFLLAGLLESPFLTELSFLLTPSSRRPEFLRERTSLLELSFLLELLSQLDRSLFLLVLLSP
jgi:hypothetical protein